MKTDIFSKICFPAIAAGLLLAMPLPAQTPNLATNPYANPLNPAPYPPNHVPPAPPRLNPEDVQRAQELLRKRIAEIRTRARKGDHKAQFNLGVVHVYGAGATLDFKLAFDNFRKSSEGAVYAPAMFNLAICHATGVGTRIDRVKAYKWWNLAAAQGHPRAAEARDKIAKYLNRNQIACAQRMGRSYTEKLETRFKLGKLRARREKINGGNAEDDAAYRLSQEFYRKR